MKKLISSIVASCLAVTAIAYCKPASADQIPQPSEQWQTVGRDANRIVSIDQGTVSRQGNFTGFWTQVISRNGNIAVARVYAVGDCSNGAFQALWLAQANRQGRILSNGNLNDKPRIASPNSPERFLLNAACGNQNPALQAQAAQAQVTQAQLEALSRARQTAQEGISNALNTAASMFK